MKSYVNENIKVLRNRMGLTQEKFAELIGINRKVIGSYEEGRATPPLDKLKAIAKLFGITIDQLTDHRLATVDTPLFNQPEETLPEEVHPEDISFKKKPFSRTGAQSLPVKVVEVKESPKVQVELDTEIRYISYRYFDKYILDEEFETRIDQLPALQLPFYKNTKNLRAFDIPSGHSSEEGIVITERVLDFTHLNAQETYVLVSSKKGIIMHQAQSNSYGDIEVLDTHLTLRPSEVKEVWKVVGYFSFKLPIGSPDLKAISDKVNALKKDLDRLL